MPDLHSFREVRTSGRVLPRQEVMPMPVTTTRRSAMFRLVRPLVPLRDITFSFCWFWLRLLVTKELLSGTTKAVAEAMVHTNVAVAIDNLMVQRRFCCVSLLILFQLKNLLAGLVVVASDTATI